jgi:hypothetical protein
VPCNCRAAPLKPNESYTIVTTRVDRQLRVYGASTTLTGQQIQAAFASLSYGSPYYNPAVAATAQTGNVATTTSTTSNATAISALAEVHPEDIALAGGRKLRDQPDGAVYEALSESDTRKFPHNVIGRLGLYLGSFLPAACTGQFISPVDVLTAAHCIDTDFESTDFRPGQFGDERRLFGT